jgi:hypothetical protein
MITAPLAEPMAPSGDSGMPISLSENFHRRIDLLPNLETKAVQ